MSFAICLQVPNFRHFDKKFSIWAEFLPQILFMECIFGYLVICIIYKWSVDWAAAGREAPSLLNMLIYMFLSRKWALRRLLLTLLARRPFSTHADD